MTSLLASCGILPPAPSAVPDSNGHPEFGRFAGRVGNIDWNALEAPYARPRWWRRFHHKRWQYVALSTPELFCGIAIVDVGWTNTAFAYAFDRKLRREVGSYSQDGIPRLTATLGNALDSASSFCWFADRIAFLPRPDRSGYGLQLRCGDFEIDADIAIGGAAPFLFATGPVAGGSVHTTQKSPGLRLEGEAKASGKRYDLRGGVASLDYSNGLLARETSWRWASAHSHEYGFNLQAGYFGDQENALWIDGELVPLGAARFVYDALDPLAPWRIYTEDGLLDLTFRPEGLRRENKNLIVAASRYVQPIGSFSGWIKPAKDAKPRMIDGLAGVTEDHYSRW
jgi:hypothetical protein